MATCSSQVALPAQRSFMTTAGCLDGRQGLQQTSSTSGELLVRKPRVVCSLAPRIDRSGRGFNSATNSGRPNVVCRADKKDAARKALEDALSGKKDSFSKWDAEIKRREEGGGGEGGGGRGRGWGGGGGGGDGDGASSGGDERWEETKQVLFAVGGIAGIYLLFTQGLRIFAFFINCILFVLRGFKGPKRQSEIYTPAAAGAAGGGGEVANAGKREEDVRKKWGGDEE